MIMIMQKIFKMCSNHSQLQIISVYTSINVKPASSSHASIFTNRQFLDIPKSTVYQMFSLENSLVENFGKNMSYNIGWRPIFTDNMEEKRREELSAIKILQIHYSNN